MVLHILLKCNVTNFINWIIIWMLTILGELYFSSISLITRITPSWLLNWQRARQLQKKKGIWQCAAGGGVATFTHPGWGITYPTPKELRCGRNNGFHIVMLCTRPCPQHCLQNLLVFAKAVFGTLEGHVWESAYIWELRCYKCVPVFTCGMSEGMNNMSIQPHPCPYGSGIR